MNTSKKACLLAIAGMMLAPAAAMAMDAPQDVVHDARGNIVVNTHGNCVLTKWEAKTNECGLMLTKEDRTVYFDFNKSTLSAAEKAKLDQVSHTINASKKVQSVDIVGYADKIGTAGYNKQLSMKRAETVKAYLASKGLKTRNVRVEALGEAHSKTNCTMTDRKELIACLAADRRVEIQLNMTK